MPSTSEFVISVRAERWCDAPRQLILEFERDPRNATSVEPRMQASNLVGEPGTVGSRHTLTVTTLKLFRIKFSALVMSEDPPIVELRRSRQVEVATVTVGAEPGPDGRTLITYSSELTITPRWGDRWIYNSQRHRTQSTGHAALERYLAKSVELIEARARSVG